MTTSELREKLMDEARKGIFPTTFAEILVAIVCEQRQALERYASRPAGSHNKEDARVTLAATDARLKSMGVL